MNATHHELPFDETHNPGFATPECENCGSTQVLPNRIWTDDGRKLRLCEECAETERRMEALAHQLAAKPSCEERERILDDCQFTSEVVNRLTAHDMACIICRPAPKFEPLQAPLFAMKEVA